MGKSTILVIGGTGDVGKYVSLASARLGHPTFLLVRDLSPSDATKAALLDSFRKAGISLVKGDLSEPASLIEALKGMDAVISVVGRPQILDQLKLLDAIKQVGTIKRFLPSEFGNHEFGNDAGKSLPILEETFLKNKTKVREAIEQSRVPYTYVISGAGASYYLPSLWQDELKAPPREKITILGDGNAKAVIIDDDDIGTYTVLAADDPRTENKFLFVRPEGIYKSQNELVALWEQKIGRTLEKSYIPKKELEQKIAGLPWPENLFLALKYSYLVQGYRSDLPNGVEASQLYPDVQYTSCSAYLDRYL